MKASSIEDPELREIAERYPRLFATSAGRKEFLDHSYLLPGWMALFDEFLAAANAIAVDDAMARRFRLYQVKEKFGLLRIYAGFKGESAEILALDDELMKKREDVQARSAFVCESCGKPGEFGSVENYYCTYCADCLKVGYPNEWQRFVRKSDPVRVVYIHYKSWLSVDRDQRRALKDELYRYPGSLAWEIKNIQDVFHKDGKDAIWVAVETGESLDAWPEESRKFVVKLDNQHGGMRDPVMLDALRAKLREVFGDPLPPRVLNEKLWRAL